MRERPEMGRSTTGGRHTSLDLLAGAQNRQPRKVRRGRIDAKPLTLTPEDRILNPNLVVSTRGRSSHMEAPQNIVATQPADQLAESALTSTTTPETSSTSDDDSSTSVEELTDDSHLLEESSTGPGMSTMNSKLDNVDRPQNVSAAQFADQPVENLPMSVVSPEASLTSGDTHEQEIANQSESLHTRFSKAKKEEMISTDEAEAIANNTTIQQKISELSMPQIANSAAATTSDEPQFESTIPTVDQNTKVEQAQNRLTQALRSGWENVRARVRTLTAATTESRAKTTAVGLVAVGGVMALTALMSNVSSGFLEKFANKLPPPASTPSPSSNEKPSEKK